LRTDGSLSKLVIDLRSLLVNIESVMSAASVMVVKSAGRAVLSVVLVNVFNAGLLVSTLNSGRHPKNPTRSHRSVLSFCISSFKTTAHTNPFSFPLLLILKSKTTWSDFQPPSSSTSDHTKSAIIWKMSCRGTRENVVCKEDM
jgi:hypothetical protein